MKSKVSERLELKRQLFHLLLGVAIAGAVYALKPVIGLLILAPLIGALSLMYWIGKAKVDIKVANHLLYHLERPGERPFKGAMMFGLGVIAPIALLNVDYGCAVILIFAFGDCFATLVGRRYGRIRLGHKSLEGSAAFMISAMIPSAMLVGPSHAMILSFSGAVIELLFSEVDDNVSVPGLLSLLAMILNG